MTENTEQEAAAQTVGIEPRAGSAEVPFFSIMNISRKKFVILFIISGFAFLFISTSLLGTTGPRGFPKYPDSVLRTGGDSPIAWKRIVSTIILPVKIVLIGPLALPQINFLKDDPPPPFIGIYLIFYWTILASIIHYLVGKIKHS